MSHKAFCFDWQAFQGELAALLLVSLTNDDPSGLIEFGSTNLSLLSDPYEGQPLSGDWIKNMEVGDTQEIADHVLTKYYDPSADQGIGEFWIGLEQSLNSSQRAALLGHSFGPQFNQFDPGRIGAYFQDEVTIRKSLSDLESAIQPELSQFRDLLRDAIRSNHGLYVTF